MSFIIVVPCKKLSGKPTFVKFNSGDHTLLKGVNEFMAIISLLLGHFGWNLVSEIYISWCWGSVSFMII